VTFELDASKNITHYHSIQHIWS